MKIELTPRQAEAVEYLASGRTFNQIAESMAISERTVQDHIYEVAKHLNGSGPPSVRVVAWYWKAHPTVPYTIKDIPTP